MKDCLSCDTDFELICTAASTSFERFLLCSSDKVVNDFFSYWPPDAILRLRCLNSNFHLSVEAYTARVWSIDNTLDRWFLHVPSFLNVLDECEGIVAGSEAQQHFGRHEFRGKDLDIYVPCHGLLQLGRWLKHRGFTYQATAGKHILFDASAIMFAAAVMGGRDVGSRDVFGTPHPNVFATFNFYRHPTNALRLLNMDGCRIRIVAVRGDPVQFLLHNFHSTGVMNYFTGKYAVSLFPFHTFIKRQMYICQDVTRNMAVHQAWMTKYRARGYTIVSPLEPPILSHELRAYERTVGDKYTWILPHERSVIPGKLNVTIPPVHFEVLPAHSGVVAAGATLRIGPKFIYSSMALIATGQDFVRLRSAEVTAAFAGYETLL